MLDFTESIPVKASPTRVWERLLDIERWWPLSNPEHASIERLDDAGEVTQVGVRVEIGVGTRFRIREKIAGVPGQGIGVVTHVDAGTAVTWEAESMRYRLYGVTWSSPPSRPSCRVHAVDHAARPLDGDPRLGRVSYGDWLAHRHALSAAGPSDPPTHPTARGQP